VGSWTKWGVRFLCGLLATLENLAQTAQITTQNYPSRLSISRKFNFHPKPKTRTKQGVL